MRKNMPIPLQPAVNGLRIIGGQHRGKKLLLPPPTWARPTSHRARAAIFNILHPLKPGGYVLDAFAGSGAMGLEALSRGAGHAIFFEVNPAVQGILRRNLHHVADHSTVYEQDILSAPPASQPMDYIFMDPPYGQDLMLPAWHILCAQGWVGQATQVVVESATPLVLPQARLITQRAYGRIWMTLFQCTPL